MTTVIVGGGLAGALNARALQLAGVEVVVVDAGEQPGGIAVAQQAGGYHLEPAAGSVILPHPQLSSLLAGLDVEVRPAASDSANRWLRHRGRTIPLRPSRIMTSGILRPVEWLRLLAEPLVGAHEEEDSLQEFLAGRLGDSAGRLAAWLVASGVHAGDPSRLAARETVPGMLAAVGAHGSLVRAALARPRTAVRPATHMVSGGTAAIARAVSELLGDAWTRGFEVERIERTGDGWLVHGPRTLEAERVIAAVSLRTLPSLYRDMPSPDSLEYAPVAVVWLGTEEPLPAAIGALAGPEEEMSTLGFLFESSYAPHRAPAGRGLVKAIVGGATRPALAGLSDAGLSDVVTAELEEVIGRRVSVNMRHVVRHLPGIPQFTPERRTFLDELERKLPPGLEVAGWEYDGVGVSSLAQAALRRAARQA